jgi:hypothetical protein
VCVCEGGGGGDLKESMNDHPRYIGMD